MTCDDSHVFVNAIQLLNLSNIVMYYNVTETYV